MNKIIGYCCLVLSFVAWGIIVVIPFIDISVGEIAAVITFLVIAGEVLFLASAALLGKDVWHKIKTIYETYKNK